LYASKLIFISFFKLVVYLIIEMSSYINSNLFELLLTIVLRRYESSRNFTCEE